MPIPQPLLIVLTFLLTCAIGFLLAKSIVDAGSGDVLGIVAKVALFAGWAMLIYIVYRRRRSNGQPE